MLSCWGAGDELCWAAAGEFFKYYDKEARLVARYPSYSNRINLHDSYQFVCPMGWGNTDSVHNPYIP